MPLVYITLLHVKGPSCYFSFVLIFGCYRTVLQSSPFHYTLHCHVITLYYISIWERSLLSFLYCVILCHNHHHYIKTSNFIITCDRFLLVFLIRVNIKLSSYCSTIVTIQDNKIVAGSKCCNLLVADINRNVAEVCKFVSLGKHTTQQHDQNVQSDWFR